MVPFQIVFIGEAFFVMIPAVDIADVSKGVPESGIVIFNDLKKTFYVRVCASKDDYFFSDYIFQLLKNIVRNKLISLFTIKSF